MTPHYYLMKHKKILRLEAHEKWSQLSWLIQGQRHPEATEVLDQEQANWRVVVFRDDILDVEEYVGYLNSPEAVEDAKLWDESLQSA